MKKTITSLIVIIILGFIYYVTLGSQQIIDEMKRGVNHELTTLTDHGFSVEDRIIESDEEHFTIVVKEPKEIYQYLLTQNIQVDPQAIRLLQDQKVGVDIKYLPSSYGAISIEFYPLNLPQVFYEQSTQKDKEIIQVLEKMVNDKVFLAHVNVNKLLTHFDGYIKDIDETFKIDDNNTTIISKNWTFEGRLDKQKLTQISNRLEEFEYRLKDLVTLKLYNLKATLTTSQEANRTILYSIDNIKINSETKDLTKLEIFNIKVGSQDQIENGLLTTHSQFEINYIDLKTLDKHQVFDRISLDVNLQNLNIDAINQLNELTSQKKEGEDNETIDTLLPLLQKIINADTTIELNKLAITSITENSKTYGGFYLSGHIKADKDFDWNQLDNNPMEILKLVDIRANLVASDQIFNLVSQKPELLMLMMFIQPKEHNGNKIYEIEYTKGSLKVNGTPLL